MLCTKENNLILLFVQPKNVQLPAGALGNSLEAIMAGTCSIYQKAT